MDKNLNIKICDFGLATKLQFDTERKTTICGTPNYTAPEILNQKKSGLGHSYEVDIWSIGVILFTLLTGKPPFETKNIRETYRRIKKIKYQFPVDSNKYISNYAKNLISEIFTKEPTKRPNLSQIANHSFFKLLPTPKSMPLCILKRVPTDKELFGDIDITDNHHIDIEENDDIKHSNYNQSRPPLVSTGYIQKNKIINKQNNKKLHSQKEETKNIINHGLNGKNNKIIKIIKYVDYTKKYGIGYILSSGNTGIYFNDSTKILLYSNKENILYIDNKEKGLNCLMTKYPQYLKKKITLLKHFSDYLWKKHDDDDNENKNDDNNDNDNNINEQLKKLTLSNNNNMDGIYVKTTICDQYCVLFKLSNNTVQVNFTDKSQIIIIDESVMYKDKIGNINIFKLNQLFSSDKRDLKKRCKYTQQLLQKITSKKYKND